VLASLAVAASAHATPPKPFNPLVEGANYSITLQRQTIYDTPQYQPQLALDSISNGAKALNGCAGMVPEADDGWPGNYSYIAIDTSPDASVGPGQGLRGGATRTGRRVAVTLPPAAGQAAGRSASSSRLSASSVKARRSIRRTSSEEIPSRRPASRSGVGSSPSIP
jgi:hypothetical protein